MANATIFRDAKPKIVIDGIADFDKLNRNNGSISLQFNSQEHLESFRKVINEAVLAGEKAARPAPSKKPADFQSEDSNPKCPKDGAPTVLRNGKKGPFYGCTKFPNCRGIVDAGGKTTRTRS